MISVIVLDGKTVNKADKLLLLLKKNPARPPSIEVKSKVKKNEIKKSFF